jgi:ring-1,2-phenylacetyl-CoA epoxidase subunit PaaC
MCLCGSKKLTGTYMTNHLLNYTLHLADNALILGHRNSEWTGHGPILEQDIALSNISLDLIGQARNYYQYAAQLKGDGATEDTLAYLRTPSEFKNCLLVEQTNGHWGKTVLRQFFFSVYQYYVYQLLQHSKDKIIGSLAEKALKEVTYHLRWSSEWVIRLGDGTKESHTKMKDALDELWQFTRELFIPAQYEIETLKEGIGIDLDLIKAPWDEKVYMVLEEATLFNTLENQVTKNHIQLGKEGEHSKHLDNVLSEMQVLQRTYPGCEW